jgi:hypothetical protein
MLYPTVTCPRGDADREGRHLDDALVLRAPAAFEAARLRKGRWPGPLEEAGL